MTDRSGQTEAAATTERGEWAEESPSPAARHLQRLDLVLPLLADISLADVLVLAPNQPSGPTDERSLDQLLFTTIAHRRPINARTVYVDDQFGRVLKARDRPLLLNAFTTGEITDGGVFLEDQNRWIRTLAVPVRHEGEIVAMLSREFSPSIEEIPGDLQLTSFAILRRLAAMIADGSYPYPVETRQHDHPPRVGDGLLLLDPLGVVEFASPNATTVLRTVGISTIAAGRRLSDLGIDSRLVLSAHGQRLAFFDEYENAGRSMSMACFPLIEHDRVTGSLVLVRDITELRSRDRLLLTKNATISEIHHRVKNNLQTISSLLHLQSRRTKSDEAREAIEESVRRIRAIAVVHEILSHKSSDEVPFGQIVQPLVQIVREALLAPGHRVVFTVEADDSILSSEMTTTLAVVVSELLQNCIDHAFPAHAFPTTPADTESDRPQLVTIRIASQGHQLTMQVADTGVGLPDSFTFATSGLGLTIVRTLVESELRGTITHHSSDTENIFEVQVPLHPGETEEVPGHSY